MSQTTSSISIDPTIPSKDSLPSNHVRHSLYLFMARLTAKNQGILKSIETSSIATMSNSASTFLSLPKEIRLMIYDHVFAQDYFLNWPPVQSKVRVPGNHLSILSTCSLIRAEAELMLNKTIFHFHYARSKDKQQQSFQIAVDEDFGPERMTLWNPTPAQMMHIDIVVDRVMNGRPIVPVVSLTSQFAGSAKLRSTFNILLRPFNSPFCRSDSEIVQAISTLTGFQKVRVEFQVTTYFPTFYQRRKAIYQDTSWRDVAAKFGPIEFDRRRIYDETVEQVVERLELGLGKGVVEDMDTTAVLYARCAEFRPRR